MATSRARRTRCYHLLRGRGFSVEAIGCAVAPRTVYEATLEGHRAARKLGKPQRSRMAIDESEEPDALPELAWYGGRVQNMREPMMRRPRLSFPVIDSAQLLMNATLKPLTSRAGPLQGRVRVPGDKSISDRALIWGRWRSAKRGFPACWKVKTSSIPATPWRAGRAGGAKRQWRVAGPWGGRRRALPGGQRARFRQFRHRRPADAWRGRRLSGHRDV